MNWQQEYTLIRDDLNHEIELTKSKGISSYKITRLKYQDRPILMEDILKFSAADKAVPEIWKDFLCFIGHNHSSPEQVLVAANFADYYRIKYQKILPTVIERILPGALIYLFAAMTMDNPRDYFRETLIRSIQTESAPT